MVSSGIHFVKNHESQFKKYLLGTLYNQTVNVETDSKTLYYGLLKLKCSLSLYLKTEINMHLLTAATEIIRTGYSTKNFQIHQSSGLHPTGPMP